MGVVILRILTSIVGGSAVSWLTSNLMVIGIAGAALLVTNAVTGTVWYVKGHNAAAAKCRVSTLIRERDELKRDRDIQKSTAEHYSQLSKELQDREDARELSGAKNASELRHVDGCVVPNRVRKSGTKR
jgi:hypothetical protein